MPTRSPSHQGFTLFELLVVLSIMAILALISVPIISSIAAAKNLDGGINDLVGMIERARSEAVTRQTYVWLGIAPVQTSSGTMQVDVAMVCSKDGTGTNTAASNLTNLTKVVHLTNLSLTDWGGLKQSTKDLFTTATPASFSTNATGITFTAGQTSFTGKTVTFTPQGEVMLKGAAKGDDGFDSWIDISIRQAHGTYVATTADDAAVLIQGSTGTVQVVRLH